MCPIYAVRQSCEGCQQTPPAGYVQYVRGACCAMCVCCPKAESTSFFADRSRLQQKKNSTQSTRVSMCCSSRQSTRRCHRWCICTLPTLRRVSLPAFAAASMAVNRRHRGAMGSVWVGRALRCSDIYACVAPEPTARRRRFSLTGRRKKKSTQSTRVSTKHTAVSSMLHLHPADPPPHDLAGPRPRVGMASPQGPALRERE